MILRTISHESLRSPYPAAWTDLPIVEKELALRAQKFTRKDLQKTPSKVKLTNFPCQIHGPHAGCFGGGAKKYRIG